ncbi:MAG: DNA-3-methyladenine glycosylase I [Campylobacter sp.]
MRCPWCEKDELYKNYHDNEWGKIVSDDRKFFEFIMLEAFQAGLSWHGILKKRAAMKVAFDDFDPVKIQHYGEAEIGKFMQDKNLIRNLLKLNSLAVNAKAFLRVVEEFDGFYNYIWGFVNGKQIVNEWDDVKQIPAKSELSDIVSKDMKKRGFKFLGSVSVYSFLQAIGVINDHLISCDFR